MKQFHDVNIFSGSGDLVMTAARIELIKSPLFFRLFSDMSSCDTCREPVSVIIADEDSQVVSAAISKVTNRSGISIIQGKAKTNQTL